MTYNWHNINWHSHWNQTHWRLSKKTKPFFPFKSQIRPGYLGACLGAGLCENEAEHAVMEFMQKHDLWFWSRLMNTSKPKTILKYFWILH